MYKTKLFFLSIKLDYYQWMHKQHKRCEKFHKQRAAKVYSKIKNLKGEVTGMTNKVKGA